jgi:hypothetical protein
MPIKQGTSLHGHDQVDFTQRVRMMRACDVFHVDHVDGKTMQVIRRLEDASVANATSLTVAQPPLCHAGLAGGPERTVGDACHPMLGIQPILQGCVHGATRYVSRQPCDLLAEFCDWHLMDSIASFVTVKNLSKLTI